MRPRPPTGLRARVRRGLTLAACGSLLTALAVVGSAAPASVATGPASMQRLAQRQTQLLLAHYVTGQVISPASCDEGQRASGTHGVFLLPTLSFAFDDATIRCAVKTDTVLLDLGGIVVTEDNRPDSTYELATGEALTFHRNNLERICDDLLRLLPRPAAAEVDGRPFTRATQLATRPVDATVLPGSGQFWDDSVLLGHPGVLAVSYCGWKTKVHLRPGRHTVEVDMAPVFDGAGLLSYTIDVRRPRGH